MKFSLPKSVWNIKLIDIISRINTSQKENPVDVSWSVLTTLTGALILLIIVFQGTQQFNKLISPLASNLSALHPITSNKTTQQVFGFSPYWNINNDKMGNIDFSVLTTFAYFGVPVGADGNLNKDDIGYQTFHSDKASELFRKAHANNTRVVLTITQMDNNDIETFLADSAAQSRAISQTVDEVNKRGIDGVNIDFEYLGTPDDAYRQKFSAFVKNLTTAMHNSVPSSKVTVSVYASAAVSDKLYDVARLAKNADAIFMMAYDFATTGSDYAMPTAPLYGAKQGKYYYDVSTAVADFLAVMPSNKLILGIPTYGYNYAVSNPKVKAETLPYYDAQAYSETYAQVQSDISLAKSGSGTYKEGWDSMGQVGWKAYVDRQTGIWRMVFIEDSKSLGIKFAFAKQQNLAGVGLWALGNDSGSNDIWGVIDKNFGGTKLADRALSERVINENTY